MSELSSKKQGFKKCRSATFSIDGYSFTIGKNSWSGVRGQLWVVVGNTDFVCERKRACCCCEKSGFELKKLFWDFKQNTFDVGVEGLRKALLEAPANFTGFW